MPLRHTIAGSALATQHSHKWLDGVSDALAYGLRWLGTYRPQAIPAIRPRLRLPGTTRLVLRTSMAGSDGLQESKIIALNAEPRALQLFAESMNPFRK